MLGIKKGSSTSYYYVHILCTHNDVTMQFGVCCSNSVCEEIVCAGFIGYSLPGGQSWTVKFPLAVVFDFLLGMHSLRIRNDKPVKDRSRITVQD